MYKKNRSESGQALIELIFVILFCFILGVGIFESGVLINNVSIMNTAMDITAKYAASGASYERLQDVINRESNNILTGATLIQEVSDQGLVVQVRNPKENVPLGSFQGGGLSVHSQCKNIFTPRENTITPYMFWAEGYEIRVGVEYGIGFEIPFLGPITVDTTVWGSQLIDAENDLDRDGMRDQFEPEYVQWAMAADGAGSWRHPVHRDGTGELISDPGADMDGDGVADDKSPYDYDNDGTEDKFDKGDNLMEYNPLMGPNGWNAVVPCP